MTVATLLPKGLKTETEILAAGFALMKEQLGLKSARYYFYYHEDYPSDLISEYNWLHEEAKI
jgi:hypothetical protein